MQGDPSRNLLARSGLITNEAGRVFEPSFGRLDLPWLLSVTPEDARRAQQAVQKNKKVEPETRIGWFIASTEKEFKGLKYLLKKDWRRALKAWKGGSVSNVHNRATLHRALFHSKDSERPEAHLRECLRLYHHLSELDPSEKFYRVFQEELIDHLKGYIERAQAKGDNESVSRSLKVLAQTVGMVAVGHLQYQFFGADLDKVRINCAKISKELLSYQGTAHPPPPEILAACDKGMTERVLPLASKFSHNLVEGSNERIEVEKTVAQVCGIISQSFAKAKDTRSSKKWLGEAMRWEPSAAQDWTNLSDDGFEDEDTAQVSFPEMEEEEVETPRQLGSFAFGIRARVQQRVLGEAREEWLESLYVALMPLFPVRRFAAYRNLDTDEVGYYIRIPLTTLDHIKQGLIVLFLSFVVTVGAMTAANLVESQKSRQEAIELRQEIDREISTLVDELKKVAQKEAKLSEKSKLTEQEKSKLKQFESKRLELIKKVEELEKSKK